MLDDTALDRALIALGKRPDTQSWARYLYLHGLIVGALLVAMGILLFVAANWGTLSVFTRLILVGGVMVGSTLLYGLLGDSLAGRSSGLFGGLLFGPLMAIYGQHYQTGADPWQLFAAWTMVLAAYATALRFSGIWIFTFLLLHLSVFTWVDQQLGLDPYGAGAWVVGLLAAVDAGLVLTIEQRVPNKRRLLARTVGISGLLMLLPFGVLLATGELAKGSTPGVVAFFSAIVGLGWTYRRRIVDHVMLAAFAGAITVVSSSAISKIIFDRLNADLFGTALLGAFIILQVGAFSRWLTRLSKGETKEALS